MTTSPARSATAAAGIALALTLTACSSGPDGDDGSTEIEAGPLDEYFEQMYGDWDEEDGNRQMLEVEEITAECMRELGFEYTPVDHSAQGGVTFSSDDLDVDWGSREFAEQYGYGATTDPWGEQEMPEPEPEQEWVDPNQEYVDAMSESEQTAYYAALYGEQTFDESADPDEPFEYDWTQAGCSGKAQHEVYEVGTGMGDERFVALQEEMNTMWESMMDDPRIAEATARWSACMADAGYSGLASSEDAQNLIYDKVNAIYENAYADVPFDEEATEEDYAAIEEAVQREISALTAEEIEVAVADFDCREDARLDAVQQELNLEYQQEFVDAHKDELDAWLESVLSAQD